MRRVPVPSPAVPRAWTLPEMVGSILRILLLLLLVYTAILVVLFFVVGSIAIGGGERTAGTLF